MVTFFSELIGNAFWATLVMSFIPLIELKGGIVFARGAGIGFFESLGLSYLGSTVAFFPVFFLLIPILGLIKKIKIFSSLADSVQEFFATKAEKAVKKAGKGSVSRSENFYKKLGVFIFVAIPLPMTGVWTGTAIAVFLDMKFKDAVLPVVIGNAVAGTIVSILAETILALWQDIKILDYVLYGLFALAAVMLVITLVKILRKKKQKAED